MLNGPRVTPKCIVLGSASAPGHSKSRPWSELVDGTSFLGMSRGAERGVVTTSSTSDASSACAGNDSGGDCESSPMQQLVHWPML